MECYLSQNGLLLSKEGNRVICSNTMDIWKYDLEEGTIQHKGTIHKGTIHKGTIHKGTIHKGTIHKDTQEYLSLKYNGWMPKRSNIECNTKEEKEPLLWEYNNKELITTINQRQYRLCLDQNNNVILQEKQYNQKLMTTKWEINYV